LRWQINDGTSSEAHGKFGLECRKGRKSEDAGRDPDTERGEFDKTTPNKYCTIQYIYCRILLRPSASSMTDIKISTIHIYFKVPDSIN
jgi:hypothetical protein